MINSNELSKERRRAVMPQCARFLLEWLPEFPDAQITATEGEYVWRHNRPDALAICRKNANAR